MNHPNNRWMLAAIAAGSFAVGYAAWFPRTAAVAAADSVAAKSDATFEVYKDKAGEYRWRLRTKNQQVIASSGEGYKEKQSCMSGIESVKRNAADAEVQEQPAGE